MYITKAKIRNFRVLEDIEFLPKPGSTACRMSLQAAFGHPRGPYAYRTLRARASISLARSVGQLRCTEGWCS